MNNRRLEKCCLFWWVSDFCADRRVRICHKQYGNMNQHYLFCFTLLLLGDFLKHLGPLTINRASFNRHSLHVYSCWLCPYSDGWFQQDNEHCHKGQVISNWFLEHGDEFTVLKRPPQPPDPKPKRSGGFLTDTSSHVLVVQSLWGIFSGFRWIYTSITL